MFRLCKNDASQFVRDRARRNTPAEWNASVLSFTSDSVPVTRSNHTPSSKTSDKKPLTLAGRSRFDATGVRSTTCPSSVGYYSHATFFLVGFAHIARSPLLEKISTKKVPLAHCVRSRVLRSPFTFASLVPNRAPIASLTRGTHARGVRSTTCPSYVGYCSTISPSSRSPSSIISSKSHQATSTWSVLTV